MSEADALSEQMEDNPARIRHTKPRRPSYRHFGIRYSQWGGEYKAECYHCGWESEYGTRGKSVKAATAHVTAKHGVDGSALRRERGGRHPGSPDPE